MRKFTGGLQLSIAAILSKDNYVHMFNKNVDALGSNIKLTKQQEDAIGYFIPILRQRIEQLRTNDEISTFYFDDINQDIIQHLWQYAPDDSASNYDDIIEQTVYQTTFEIVSDCLNIRKQQIRRRGGNKTKRRSRRRFHKTNRSKRY